MGWKSTFMSFLQIIFFWRKKENMVSSRVRNPLQNVLPLIWLFPPMVSSRVYWLLSQKRLKIMTRPQGTIWNTTHINHIKFQIKDMLPLSCFRTFFLTKHTKKISFLILGVLSCHNWINIWNVIFSFQLLESG